MDFTEWLLKTQELQIAAYQTDPARLEGQERARYSQWNVLAATDELHEALQEIQWKPWVLEELQGEWIDRDAFVGEIVDVLHFVANLLVMADCSGFELSERYLAKMAKNAQRQRDGYTGEKDADGREIDRDAMYDASILALADAQRATAAAQHAKAQEENAKLAAAKAAENSGSADL